MKAEPEKYLPPAPRAAQTDALRLLQMVHEFHKAGFQLLRISPGMAPSGIHWRCGIYAAAKNSPKNAKIEEIARYSSASGRRYFDWDDAGEDAPVQLAEKFAARFPSIVERSFGADWRYAGWFVEMLGFAERGAFPIFFADYPLDPNVVAELGHRRLAPPQNYLQG